VLTPYRVKCRSTMKKKLIVHGGMHKTGSSAIQTLLQNNRDFLAEKGVLFPVAGTIYHPGIGRRHFYVRETLFDTHERVDGLFNDLLIEAKRYDCHTVILSYENFLSPGNFSPDIVEFIQKNFNVHLLCYFRDPINYFNTKYKEWVRRLNFQGEPGDFVLSHFGYINWEEMLERWMTHFGSEGVACREFDKAAFLDGKIEFDFIEYLSKVTGVDFSGISVGGSAVNPSFNNDQVLVSLMRNRYFGGYQALSPRQKKIYRSYIRSLDGSARNGLILSKTVANFLKSHSEGDREYVAKRMGVVFDIPAISNLSFDDSYQCIHRRAQIKRSLERRLSSRFSWIYSANTWITSGQI